MKKLGVFITFMALGSLIVVIGYSGQNGTMTDSVLNRQVQGVNLKNVTAKDALVDALINAGEPGGVAVLQNCSEPVRHILTPIDASLRGVLDSITSADPQYKWEIREGVVNLTPRSNDLPFLSVRVHKLGINQAATPNEALEQLLALPEVREQARLNLGRRLIQGGLYSFNSAGATPNIDRKIFINVADVSVREVLNAIARAHGSAVWTLTQGQCNGQKVFAINFVAR